MSHFMAKSYLKHFFEISIFKIIKQKFDSKTYVKKIIKIDPKPL